VPLYIGLAEKDRMVSPTLRRDLEGWLAASKVRDYIFVVYPGMDHGFTVRPDNKNPEIRSQCKRAFDDAALFLHKFKQ
jgi:dienelactone hydrolase